MATELSSATTTKPLGTWAYGIKANNGSSLFWARAFLGLSPADLRAVGAKDQAGVFDNVPVVEHEDIDEFAALVRNMPSDSPVLQFVQRVHGPGLAEVAKHVQTSLSMTTPLGAVDMARLFVLALHPDSKSKWNSVLHNTPAAWLGPRTFLSGTASLDTLATMNQALHADRSAFEAHVGQFLAM